MKYLRIKTCATICVLCGIVFYAFTCQKRAEGPVIARVGREILTLNDLNERIPAEYSDKISREQKINYVKNWIDTEILFRQALRQKIHREPEIRSRIRQMKKDLLCAEIISRNASFSGKYPVSEEAVRNYYSEHPDQFVREYDVIKYVEIVLNEKSTALDVSRQITADNFLDLAGKYSKAPVQDSRAISYLPLAALPEGLAQKIPSMKQNVASAPLEIDSAYHIVMILDKQPAGTMCSLEEVREDIIGTLSTMSRKKVFEEHLSGLRLKTDYDLHLDRIPGAEPDQKISPP